MGETDIVFFRPCELLQPYVRYYWVLKRHDRFSTLTFPIGCPQIIFHRQSPLFIPELDTRQDVFTISGQVNFPAHIRSDGDTEMIVTVFHPHAVGAFISTPPISFYNCEISGYDINDRSLNELASRVLDCGDSGRCVRLIERWLLMRLRDIHSTKFSRIGSVVKRMIAFPSTPITELAGISCLGKKQFERVFSNCVGMMPKEYSRIVRFQKSLWLMQNGQDNTGIAYDTGYADQSHFIREFKMFTGCTPGRLRDECSPYSDLFTQPV